MITDYMRTETPSGATFLIGTDSESFATRLKQAANGTKTPTPSDGQDGAGEEGGPIRRFTDAFGSLQMGTLEAVGLSGHEIADAIQMRVTELYRNQFPVPKSRFEVKCRECGEEFEEKVERCPECAGEVREPDPAEKRRLKQLLKSVNREGQSLRELGKALEWDQWLTGVPILVIRYDYHLQDGEVIQREPNELVKGDPKRIVPVVDENNRIGNWWWACPKCRHEDGYKPEEQDGWCEECDARLREVYYAEQADQKGDDMDAFYFREEVLTFPWAFPRLHGLDGLSPVHHIWLKQVIIDFQDAYAGAFYDPESERLPNQFIVLHTTNPDAWEERLREARENSKDDVYDSPVFANQYSPQDASTPEVQVVDAMPDELLGQNEQLKEQLKKDIRQAINIADVFDSDLKDAGGLNNEGLQIEVTDRSIATQQHDYTEGWLDTLTKRLGIQDWSIGFIPATGPDAEDLQKEVKAGMMADQAGLDATMEDGQTTVADGPFDAPEQTAPADGGFGDGFGGGPPDESEQEGDNSSHDMGPTANKADPMANGHQLDPETGEGICENTGEPIQAELMSDLTEDCPHCGQPLSVLGEKGNFSNGQVADPEKATRLLFEAHKHMVYPDLVEQKAREPFWSEDEAMPEFVKKLVEEALNRGAISAVSKHLPASVTRLDIQDFLSEKLDQRQGWSLRSLTKDYADRFDVTEEQAASAVRRQTKAVLDKGREIGYEQQGNTDDRLFKWVGPIDDRKTDASWEILEKTNPDHGGEPVPLDELKRIVQRARRKHFPDLRGAEWADSWQDRDTFTESFD